jgi:hypothetical protein
MQRRKFMSIRAVISLAGVAVLGIALVSADAFAAQATARGGTAGVRGAYARPNSYNKYGYVPGSGFNPYTHDTAGYNPGYRYGSDPSSGAGFAAGAVVGGAIAAGTGYTYAPAGSYNNYGYTAGTGFNPYTHDTSGYNPGYAYSSGYNYPGDCTSDPISCNGQCWLNDNGTHYRWGACPVAKKHH